MKSSVIKRSVVISGHKTSVSLEEPFWQELKEIARSRAMTLSNTVQGIDTGRRQGNLSSAIRLFVLDDLRVRLSRTAGSDLWDFVSAAKLSAGEAGANNRVNALRDRTG
ncbi:MAG: ribbon-helix-helix domain-containing protein [Xanthobacteraceae bacterium]|nr:ribbon-helix-helix domain-containing protein [Xanthobacteraceae bacterium]